MWKYSLLLFFHLIYLNSTAQFNDRLLSQPQQFEKANYVSKIVGEMGALTILVECDTKFLSKEDYYITAYDTSTMAFRWRKKINIVSHTNNALEYEDLVLTNERCYLILRSFDSQNKIVKIYMQSISNEGLQSSELVELASLKASVDGFFSYQIKNLYRVISTIDKTQALLVCEKGKSKKDNTINYGVRFINEGRVEEEKEFTLPDVNENSSIANVIANGKKQLYFFSKKVISTIDSTQKKGLLKQIFTARESLGYQLSIVDLRQMEVESFPIRLSEKKYIYDAKMTYDPKSDMVVCSGYYYTQTSTIMHSAFIQNFDGIFLRKYDADARKNVFKKEIDLKQEHIEVFGFSGGNVGNSMSGMGIAYGNGSSTKVSAQQKYVMGDLLIKDNGNVVLLSEYFCTVVTQSTQSTTNYSGNSNYGLNQTNTTTTRKEEYFSEDIVILEIDVNGNVNYSTRIKKKQKSKNRNPFYFSYVVVQKNNDLLFLFNDHYKNSETEANHAVNSSKRAALVLVHVDVKGRQERSVLLDEKKQEGMLCPLLSCENLQHSVIALIRNDRGHFDYSVLKVRF